MPECTQKGCTNDSSVTVFYEDPEERVPYCRSCGTYHFNSDPRARKVEVGLPEDE